MCQPQAFPRFINLIRASYSNNLSPYIIFEGSRLVNSDGMWNPLVGIATFKTVVMTFNAQGYIHSAVLRTNEAEGTFCVQFGYLNTSDNVFREWIIQFTTAGRFLADVRMYISRNRGAFSQVTTSVSVTSIVGYRF